MKKHIIKADEVTRKYYNIDFEKQKTFFHIDCAKSQIYLCSCRKTVIRNLTKKSGQSNKVYKIRD